MTDGPHDHRLEAEVLAACLIEPAETIPRIAARVTQDTWHLPANRMLWEAIDAIFARGDGVDVASLRAELAAAGNLERIGGVATIMGLLDRDGRIGHAPQYVDRLEDMARVRAVVAASQAVVAEGLAGPPDTDTYCAEAAAAVRKAATTGTARHAVEAKSGIIETLERLESGRGVVDGLQTGFHAVDHAIGGIPMGRVTVIAGRPAMGKTALAMTLVARLCSAGRRVHVVTLEMSAGEVFARLLSLVSGVYLGSVVRGVVEPQDAPAVLEAAEQVATWPLTVDDRGGLTAAQCVASIGAVHAEHPVDVAVVDHFHLLSHRRARGQRTDDAMAGSSGVLRDAAKREGWALLLLAQLNRGSERRDSKRPTMGDIREAGALEQDAYAIVAPWRPAVYDKDADKHDAELLVLKNRSGSTAPRAMRWRPRVAGHEDVQ